MTATTSVRRHLISQFHRPTGPVGRVAGWVMAHRSSNVERNRWAVDQLDVGPADRVLEVGFGPGVAVEALARRVTSGVVHGVDHSGLMVAKAARRNAAAVADGRVRLHEAGVAEVPALAAAGGWGPLDLVLAVNNAGMWPDPPARLAELAGLLAPGGRIAIGTQPRGAGTGAEVSRRAAEEVAGLLRAAGLDDIETHLLDLAPPMALVVGRR
jgi:SAM-dependent methyltransferase